MEMPNLHGWAPEDLLGKVVEITVKAMDRDTFKAEGRVTDVKYNPRGSASGPTGYIQLDSGQSGSGRLGFRWSEMSRVVVVVQPGGSYRRRKAPKTHAVAVRRARRR